MKDIIDSVGNVLKQGAYMKAWTLQGKYRSALSALAAAYGEREKQSRPLMEAYNKLRQGILARSETNRLGLTVLRDGTRVCSITTESPVTDAAEGMGDSYVFRLMKELDI